MFVVAITKLGTSVEDEAAPLAQDLGITTYEARLALNAGLPTIVLKTVDKAAAQKLRAQLAARGHGAVAFAGASVLPCDRMTLMRHFTFEKDAVALSDRDDTLLPFEDIAVLLRATHRTRTETETAVAGKKEFSMGRALLSGGMMLTKKVATKEHSISMENEQVLYLFRASGAPPWLLRERAANYAALGAELAPSSAQNFMTTIRRLRKLAPGAAYDERLMTARAGSRITHAVGTNSESIAVTSAGGVDLLAHVIALSFAAPP